jgi:hypothetical protein
VVGMRIYKVPASRERNMVPANPICKNKAAGLAIGRYSPTLKQSTQSDRKKSVEDLPL